MNGNIKILVLIIGVMLLLSLLAKRDVDLFYWASSGFLFFCILVIKGYLRGEEFYAGYAGHLSPSKSNRKIRLLSFVLNVILLMGVVIVLLVRFFL
ncbi:hypothetical protein FEF65_02480 [Mariprofundus erugo]|uniref:Uncharacterized protein n=1 Tax=Mariprofundus erugo TaxID=2528639 RepID=A0A5R9GWJ8_9PROT|nr:hypothetical protein [Mariprofundus erugo]TLS68593.1 hypothetical protein FEF65_02480 [Mariprofundus erugo]